MKQNRMWCKLYSTILAFFLFLLFSGVLFLFGVHVGAFNKKMILVNIGQSNYYEKNYENLTERLGVIMEESKIPISVVTNVISFQRFYVQERGYIESVINGKKDEWAKENWSNELTEGFQEYLKLNKIPFTKEIQVGLEEIHTRIMQEYNDSISFPFLEIWSQYRTTVKKITWIAVPLMLLVAILLMIVILTRFHYIHRGLRYVSYSMIGAAIMNALIGFFLRYEFLNGGYVEQKGYYRDFIQSYMEGSVKALFYGAAIGVLLFIILLAIIHLTRNKVIGDKRHD